MTIGNAVRRPRLLVTLAVGVLLALAAAGCGGGGAKPIPIGLVTSLTGTEIGVGKDVARGVELAIEEVNEAGGIRARQLELITEDCKCSAQVATEAVRKLIDTDNVPAIVNGTRTDILLEWLEYARSKGVIVLNVAATTAAGEEQTRITNTVFTLGVPAAALGQELARWAHGDGHQRIAVLGPDNPFGADFRRAAAEELRRLGRDAVVSASYVEGRSDYTATVNAVAATRPDAIICGLYGDDGKTLVPQAVAARLSAPWYVPYPSQVTLDNPALGEGRVFGIEVGYNTASAQRFRKRFAARFPHARPTAWSAFSHDGIWLLAQAMRQQGENTKALAAVFIRGAPGYSGASGRIEFNEQGVRINPLLERLRMTRTGDLVPVE
ncbi:MAG: ABC transporter substrate-binding protein [Armatimonadota bacterium]|nr:ABC transporter substrate-binding protein [Armatimonadota bacterium]